MNVTLQCYGLCITFYEKFEFTFNIGSDGSNCLSSQYESLCRVLPRMSSHVVVTVALYVHIVRLLCI